VAAGHAARALFVAALALGLAWLGSGAAHAAFPGHNGQITFQSARDSRHPDIYTMNPDGRCITRLTRNPSLDGFPAWSPDGRRIAWVSTRNGATDIYVMNANGSDQQRLTDSPAFDGGPAWSPDGERIAFRSDRSGHPEIHVMDADGSNPTRLTDNPSFDGAPSWSPDGRRIAFTSTRDGSAQIYAINARGSGEVRLTDTPTYAAAPDWSPDGQRIAFDSYRAGSFGIFAMNGNGSDQTRLTSSPREDGGPAWSPDGERIAFRSNRDGVNQIYAMNADGSDQTRLTNNLWSDRRASWQPLPLASNRFCFGKLRRATTGAFARLWARGFARQRIKVPGPGTVSLERNKNVRHFARPVEEAGVVDVVIRPRGRAKRRLARAGRTQRRVQLRVRARITLDPEGGPPRTRTKRVWLVRVGRR
jgi:Tol biopolymer transport system component